MGRLSELFWYIDEEEHPTKKDIKLYYHYIDINKELKEIRRIYRKKHGLNIKKGA